MPMLPITIAMRGAFLRLDGTVRGPRTALRRAYRQRRSAGSRRAAWSPVSSGRPAPRTPTPLELPGVMMLWLLPLEPSMMVMILEPGGATAVPAAATVGAVLAETGESTLDCCVRSLSGLSCAAPGALAATTAVGSPPSGSLTRIAQPTTTSPNRPSTPASNCGMPIGNFGNFLCFLCWPRGAFRSSVVTARILANHYLSLARAPLYLFTWRGGERHSRKRGVSTRSESLDRPAFVRVTAGGGPPAAWGGAGAGLRKKAPPPRGRTSRPPHP